MIEQVYDIKYISFHFNFLMPYSEKLSRAFSGFFRFHPVIVYTTSCFCVFILSLTSCVLYIVNGGKGEKVCAERRDIPKKKNAQYRLLVAIWHMRIKVICVEIDTCENYHELGIWNFFVGGIT